MAERFVVHQIQIESKRSVVLFRTDPYQPTLVPLIYSVLRLKNSAVSTAERKLTALKFLYGYYLEVLSIDLDEYLINRKIFPILAKFQEFVSWLAYSERVIGLQSREAYLFAITEYLSWANNRYGGNTKARNQISDLYQSYKRYLPSLPKINTEKSISEEEMNAIMRVADPTSVENPFRGTNVIRNYIMIKLLRDTGVRLGELLKIKCSDIHSNENRYYLEIINNEDDNTDTRYREPGLKNDQSQRIVSITEELYDEVMIYITKYRRPIKNSKAIKLKHGYLLVSERGLPLSKGSVTSVIDILTDCITQRGSSRKITPHSFRHAFAESFLENLIEVQQISMERAKDELRAIMGWSLDSIMPVHYAKNYISRSANSFNLARINSKINKI